MASLAVALATCHAEVCAGLGAKNPYARLSATQNHANHTLNPRGAPAHAVLPTRWYARQVDNIYITAAYVSRNYAPYLLGLLAMIKCSICSYQCDN